LSLFHSLLIFLTIFNKKSYGYSSCFWWDKRSPSLVMHRNRKSRNRNYGIREIGVSYDLKKKLQKFWTKTSEGTLKGPVYWSVFTWHRTFEEYDAIWKSTKFGTFFAFTSLLENLTIKSYERKKIAKKLFKRVLTLKRK
jgi:hypothetical protein